MAGRVIPGLPKSVDVSGLTYQSPGERRRRRALAAFATGAALVFGSWAALHQDVAGALAAGRDVLGALSGPVGGRLVQIPISDPAPWLQPEKRAAATMIGLGSRRPVCVRLCDGYFFPLTSSPRSGATASAQADCAGLCPDAPTALYFLPAGSDKIEDAASASGQRYTALPVSLRYRTTLDNTCACHHAIAQTLAYWQDPTLRKGDAVMTPDGIVVFSGTGRSPYSRRDFTTLAAATMPDGRRAALTAMERVSALPPRGADRLRIAAAAKRPDAGLRGADETRFAAPLASADN